MDDTIVAVSTAAGAAARSIVRLSGPEAVRLAGTIFAPSEGRLEQLGGFISAAGRVAPAAGQIELPAWAYVFRAPRSYTRQDVVELHTPGCVAAVNAIVSALIAAGARASQAGEFTARAFFSGRIDLSAAEAVADVINAADGAQLRSAAAAMGGSVFRLCRTAAGQMADVLATVEASIDLAGQDIVLDAPMGLADLLGAQAERLERIAGEAASLPDAAEHAHVVIAGRCNVGKSSLLNALTGVDRSIVSALAGTTRDVLSASVKLAGGACVVFQDVAGLTGPADALSAAADNAARRAVTRADVLLFVVDLTAGTFDDDLALLAEVRSLNRRCPLRVLGNKTDLADRTAPARLERQMAASGADGAGGQILGASAVSGEGLAEVLRAVEEHLQLHADRSGAAMGLHERQKQCLLASAEAARRAAELLATAGEVADVAELAAIELRVGLGELGRISGQVVTEDVLGRIFQRFCVGK